MDKYIIPKWCKMPLAYHQDGMDGCWGISNGYVVKDGEKYCKTCEFHKLFTPPTDVKLDKDQGLPAFARVDIEGRPEVGRWYDGYLAGQNDLIEAGWRKVE